MEPIQINSNNYHSFLPLDVVAFDYAADGECEDGGGVNVITSQGQHYYFNRVTGDINENQIEEILPFIPFYGIHSDKQWPFKWEESWSEIHMGMGNELYIRKEYYDSLQRAWKDFSQTEDGKNRILYNVWQRLVIDIFKQ